MISRFVTEIESASVKPLHCSKAQYNEGKSKDTSRMCQAVNKCYSVVGSYELSHFVKVNF
jgi:hypothetical protein